MIYFFYFCGPLLLATAFCTMVSGINHNTNSTTFMQKLTEQIKEQIALYQENAEAFTSKNSKAAGARARKATLELTKLFKDFRKQSIEESKK